MERYLVFSFSTYYPQGGFNDFVDSYDNLDQAIDRLSYQQDEEYHDRKICFNGHIIDGTTGEKVYSVGEEVVGP